MQRSSKTVTLRRLVQILVAVLSSTSAAVAHPKPGAHADVRITVTPTGVRLDLLMNLMFVDGLVRADRQQADAITPGEEAELHRALAEYFGTAESAIGGLRRDTPADRSHVLDRGNTVNIDGIVVAPIERGFGIVRPAPETRPGFEQNPLMLIPQVRLSLEYASKSPPSQVEVVWGTFPLDFIAQNRDTPPPTQIEAILISPTGVEQIIFTDREPSYTWHNPGARALPKPPAPTERRADRGIPVLSVALLASWGVAVVLAGVRSRAVPRLLLATGIPIIVGAWLLMPYARVSLGTEPPAISEAEELDVFATLHANIYRAFDYTTEGEVYDALAQSVDGQLLDSMYSQIYTSLIMFEEGGAVSRVRSVRPLESGIVSNGDSDARNSSSFRVRARWRVEGVVYHWGHSHTRLNEYLAEYDVAATPRGWRIVRVAPLEQFRVDAGGATSPSLKSDTETWHPNR